MSVLVARVSRGLAVRRIALVLAMAVVATSFVASPPAAAYHTSGTIHVSEGFATAEDRPGVAVGAAGQIYVAYERNNAGARDILVRADPDGWASEGFPVFTTVVVANDVPGAAQIPAFWTTPIAVDGSGSVYVAWIDTRSIGTTGTDLRIARSDNRGATFGTSARVSDFAGANAETYPGLAVGPSGTVYMVWSDNRNGAQDVFFAKSTNGGLTWSANVVVNDRTGVDVHTYPRIAVDSQERLFVTWTNFSGFARPMFDSSTDGGATWGTDLTLGEASAPSGVSHIAVGRNDIIHVAWLDYRSGDAGVYYARSLDHGASFLAEARAIAPGATRESYPRVATTWDGTVHILNTPEGGSDSLQDAIFFNDGSSVWYNSWITWGVVLADMTVDADGAPFYIWSQNDGAQGLEVYLSWQDAPPRPVSGLSVNPAGPGAFTITWLPSPSADVAGYAVYRYGANDQAVLVATVGASTTSVSDAGLADGRWWYYVAPFDRHGHSGNSVSAYGDIGLTTDDRLGQLETEMDDLQTQLGGLQGDVTNLQNQNNGLQTDLDDANSNLDRLSGQLASSQQLNLILLILVVVLVVVSMVLSMRRRRGPEPTPSYQPPMQTPPPPQ